MSTTIAMTEQPGPKPRCGAKKRAGGPCGRPAGWGTDHVGRGRCKLHGGSTPTQKKAVAKQDAAALARVYGMPQETTHQDAAEQELWRAQGIVTWLADQVAALEVDDAYGPVGGGEFSKPRQEPHAWIAMLGSERDRLARAIRLCHDLGMDERRVRVAEQIGGMLATTIGGVLRELGVHDHPDAPAVVRRHLLALTVDGTAEEAA